MNLLQLSPNQGTKTERIRCKLDGRFVKDGDLLRVTWPDGTLERIRVKVVTEKTEVGGQVVLQDRLWHTFIVHNIELPFLIPMGVCAELIKESDRDEKHVI